MDEIFIDLNFLTESERDLLRDVLARDDEFRRQEKKRLRYITISLQFTLKTPLLFIYYLLLYFV